MSADIFAMKKADGFTGEKISCGAAPGPIVQRYAFLKTIRQSKKSIPKPSNRALHLSDSCAPAFLLQGINRTSAYSAD